MTRMELVERLERTYQRLQQFQECYAVQLSHTDRQWLHQTLHEVAHYHAELSSGWRTGSTAPERQRIVPQWQMPVRRTLQRLAQQVRTTVQRTQDTARALRSMAPAARQRRLRQGLIPMCAFCKQIRDERGAWQRLEAYMHAHFAVQFTHDFCPLCTQQHYGLTLADEADSDKRPRGDQHEVTWSRAFTGSPHAGGPYDCMDPSTTGAVSSPGISHADGVRSPNTPMLRRPGVTCREDGPTAANRRTK